MSTKVLIVDDEAEFASTLAERLVIRGYNAKAVYQGDDAMQSVKNDPPDVILLDLRMPGVNGFEILQTIKAFDPTIEVILLTGQPQTEGMSEGVPTGLFDYIVKPVDIGELIKKIINANEKRHKR
jgi:DNA-binding NtrC family response regulator